MSLSRNIAKAARQPWTIFFALVAIGLIFMVGWRAHVAKRLDKRLQEIRAAGLPVSGAEITKWRPTPLSSKNGAPAMKDAYFSLHPFSSAQNSEELSKLLAKDGWESEHLDRLRRHVETNRVAIKKLRAALEFPEFAFIKDYSPGPALLLPHLSKLRETANLLAAKAALEMEDGLESEFLRDIQTIIRIAETLNSEPIIVSAFVRMNIIQTAIESTRRALNRKPITRESCLQLEKDFTRIISTNLLPAAVIGERALMLPTFRAHPSEMLSFFNSSPSAIEAARFQLLVRLGVVELEAIDYTRLMDEVILSSSDSPPRSFALTNRVNDDALFARKTGPLARTLVASLERIPMRDARFRANVATVVTALAVERFRLERGEFPESLNDLVPKYISAPPLDPYLGEPIGYKRTARGYRVYSVDEDGQDDGGTTRPKTGRGPQKTFDIVFEVAR